MRLHHPNGESEDSITAYADDWSLWRKQLTMLLNTIVEEPSYLVKLERLATASKQKVELVWDNFKQLAVEVLRQVRHLPTKDSEFNLFI